VRSCFPASSSTVSPLLLQVLLLALLLLQLLLVCITAAVMWHKARVAGIHGFPPAAALPACR
jgi:uncharacterized iron-regulated membrane protein